MYLFIICSMIIIFVGHYSSASVFVHHFQCKFSNSLIQFYTPITPPDGIKKPGSDRGLERSARFQLLAAVDTSRMLWTVFGGALL